MNTYIIKQIFSYLEYYSRIWHLLLQCLHKIKCIQPYQCRLNYKKPNKVCLSIEVNLILLNHKEGNVTILVLHPQLHSDNGNRVFVLLVVRYIFLV
jgi:hypothetical protein